MLFTVQEIRREKELYLSLGAETIPIRTNLQCFFCWCASGAEKIPGTWSVVWTAYERAISQSDLGI